METVTATVIPEEKQTTVVKPSKELSIIHLDQSTGKVDLSKYSPADIQKYKAMSNQLNTTDNNSILNFGLELQNKLAGHSDAFLNNIKSFDAGEIGNTITDLLTEINYIDIDPSQKNMMQRLMYSIPFLKKIVQNTEKIFSKYDTVAKNVDGIVTKLDKGRLTILKDNVGLQSLFEQNIDFIKELEELIVAGHIKYQDLEQEIANMELNKEQFQDYEISDKREFLTRLSKRLNDMSITRMITIQSIPQIRLVQNNNSSMVEKIQSSITTTIPIWRNQISIAVAIMRQEKMAEVQENVTNTTNTILTKNAQMLKQNSIKIAKQNERGVVDIETIRAVQENLISTLEEIKTIKVNGESARQSVAKELETLEKSLKEKILGNSSVLSSPSDKKQLGS